METRFSLQQLARADIAEAESILRKCVHCGFCTATCPSYVVRGDELDSPRGRIYLIKDFLENDRPVSKRLVTHIDRCLSCLSCMTTCPSAVDYMHLVDRTRERIEQQWKRSWTDRLLRNLLAGLLPFPERFRLALRVAALVRAPGLPLLILLRRSFLARRLRVMLRLAPDHLPRRRKKDIEGLHPANNRPEPESQPRKRVGYLPGCAQDAMAPAISLASLRVLNAFGCEVLVPENSGCCGALEYHLGKAEKARTRMLALIGLWEKAGENDPLDAIVNAVSGCGSHLKDYDHIFAEDPANTARAAWLANLSRDIGEFLIDLPLPDLPNAPPATGRPLVLAWHPPCSLQHGQKKGDIPRQILEKAGFSMRTLKESHLCCGSAGVYNILQPDIARELRYRKIDAVRNAQADVVVTANAGCIAQLRLSSPVPVLHWIQIMDWACGGPIPPEIETVLRSGNRRNQSRSAAN